MIFKMTCIIISIKVFLKRESFELFVGIKGTPRDIGQLGKFSLGKDASLNELL